MEREEYLISAIVPVYNVEEWLERCVNSLLGQTYHNLEIILVDDGSTDGSPALCDRYAEREERVRVIHKQNGGLSSARNAGVEAATGDYVTFIDSDDWLEGNTYEYAVSLLKERQADVVQYNYVMVRDEGPVSQPKEKIEVFHGKDVLQYYMESTTKTGSYSVCRCLFPASALKPLRFREGKINEDVDYKYKALEKCHTLVNTNQYQYHYFQKGQSLSTGGLKEKDMDLYEAAEELWKLTREETYGSIARLGRVKVARTAFSLLSKIAYYGIQEESLDPKQLIPKLTKEHRKNLRILLFSPMPVSRKILSILFAINFSMTKGLLGFVKKLR